MTEKQSLPRLTGGILKEYYEKLRENFYTGIDVDAHVKTYEGVHDGGYAEPEFTGKFIDVCTRYWDADGDERALSMAARVVESILRNQRADGYLGCLEPGNEAHAFSVWNQAFTMLGLIRYERTTGDQRALEAAIKCAHGLHALFLGEGAPDLLDAGNQGSQHISMLYPLALLYERTGDRKTRELIEKIIARCEDSDMNLLSFDSILTLRSQKGIEMLVVYLGVLEYGRAFDCPQAVEAARRYWREVNDTQIRNTGNGTIGEFWREGGNEPCFLPAEVRPNENCVAVGFLELALALFWQDGDAVYLDAIEKTLFNHILGSVSRDGGDFAYYQPNFGRKVFRTAGGMYQCCRYRGYTLFSCLRALLYRRAGDELTPVIYAASEYAGDGLTLSQATDYPAGGHIEFRAQAARPMTLRLRIPACADGYRLTVNGEAAQIEAEDGFVKVPVSGETEVCLELDLRPRARRVEIRDRVWKNLFTGEDYPSGAEGGFPAGTYAEFTCGPLLLAADGAWGNDIHQAVHSLEMRELPARDGTLRRFEADGVQLVDYASAGAQGEEYTVFVPVR